MARVRVLLSEGSSLTAREVLTCLGPAGYRVEALDPDRLCLGRFSRWMHRVHRCSRPGDDPVGYLDAVKRVVLERRIDVVLPTHEQAWLFAVGAPVLSGVPVAVAHAASFDRVQSKVKFARLLDELGLPQPSWRLVSDRGDLQDRRFPYWLKSAFSTAGRGVRLVTDERTRADAERELLGPMGRPVMAQEPASGRYAQVQGLFDRGRLGAAHTSVQTGTGIGPSAAAQESADHPIPRRDIAMLGEALKWHGGLTLDYLHEQGEPSYIECNPRMVEPGNAAVSGVNLPELQIRLTMGERLPSPPRTGRPGVRTHGTIALVLGAAAYAGTRRAVGAELARAITRRGCYHASAEQLTPVLRDPPSAAAAAFIIGQAFASPRGATEVASKAVARYSITPKAVEALAADTPAAWFRVAEAGASVAQRRVSLWAATIGVEDIYPRLRRARYGHDMPELNRRFILRRRPEARITSETFELVEEAVPEIKDGEALVRTRWISLDPTNRAWLLETPTYLPPVAIGEVMRSVGLAQVVASKHAAYREGQLVVGLTGWQEWAVASDAAPFRPVPAIPGVRPSTYLGVLGTTGLTAWIGLKDIGRPQPGETLVVSAAAGGVGSVVAQIAKIKGARVVGIAGGSEKCALLTGRLGLDAAVDHKASDWHDQLVVATPDGIDVDFENVGGEIMDAVFARLNIRARVVLCGLISGYNDASPRLGPRSFSNLLVQRARLEGFIVLDHLARMGEAAAELSGWIQNGKLETLETVVEGFDQLPTAINMLFDGANIGKLVLHVAD